MNERELYEAVKRVTNGHNGGSYKVKDMFFYLIHRIDGIEKDNMTRTECARTRASNLKVIALLITIATVILSVIAVVRTT